MENHEHATPEEIAQEKERRWWEKLGRKPNEYRKGDVASSFKYTREIISVFDGKITLDGIAHFYRPDELKLVVPTETRLDKDNA